MIAKEFTNKVLAKKAASSLGEVRECVCELLSRIALLEEHEKQLKYRLKKFEKDGKDGDETPMNEVEDEEEKTPKKPTVKCIVICEDKQES